MGGDRNGITVIEGGCPCMFNPTADPGHKAMRFVFTLTGNMRRRVLRHGRGCQRASAGRGPCLAGCCALTCRGGRPVMAGRL
jgi:hypothetical protein